MFASRVSSHDSNFLNSTRKSTIMWWDTICLVMFKSFYFTCNLKWVKQKKNQFSYVARSKSLFQLIRVQTLNKIMKILFIYSKSNSKKNYMIFLDDLKSLMTKLKEKTWFKRQHKKKSNKKKRNSIMISSKFHNFQMWQQDRVKSYRRSICHSQCCN